MTEQTPLGQYPPGGPDWATIARWEDDGRPDLNPDGTPAIVCRWTEHCTRGAIGTVLLRWDLVPACKQCATEQHLSITLYADASWPDNS